MTRLVWSLFMASLAACASAPPARTVQLRAFLGAADDGRWAFAEVNEFPGGRATGVVRAIGTDGKAAELSGLSDAAIAQAVAAAAAAGESPRRTAETALGPAGPAGFSADRAPVLAAKAGAGRWPLPFDPAAELELRREGDELRVLIRLAGGTEDLVAHRVPAAGTSWVDGVLLLPGNRRALVQVGSATTSGGAIYRLEGLSEIDLGAGIAALLDSRAIRHIEAGALALAKADLLRAVAIAPDDANSHYNLACTYALADEQDLALLSLGRAIDLEPGRLGPLALADPDLASLRSRVEFRLMVEPRAPGSTP